MLHLSGQRLVAQRPVAQCSAPSAQPRGPSGVALDAVGNLYIVDTDSERVRKVSNGVITTMAGNGTYGFSGDNGPAISAQLGVLSAIAVDSAGNAYVAGETESSNLPVTAGALQITLAGHSDAFVAKVNSTGTAWQYLTYLGGNRYDGAEAIAVLLWLVRLIPPVRNAACPRRRLPSFLRRLFLHRADPPAAAASSFPSQRERTDRIWVMFESK